MRLLICTQKMDLDDSILGFTHRWVLEFARVYDEVTVVCLYKGRVELPANVRVFSLGKEEGVSRLTYVWRFFSYIVSEQTHYDHVFVHMNQIYVLLGMIPWKAWGKAVGFWYAHGHVPRGARLAARLADTLFTSTEHGFPIPLKNRAIVGQGIDLSQFACSQRSDLGQRSDLCKIVTVGRLSPVKNIEVLIEAVALLRERGRAPALTIVGGADTDDQKAYEAKLRTLVKEKDLESNVTFAGAIPNHELPQKLCEADIFVNTGMTGSLDKAGLEAIAAGLPVLACNPAYEVIFKEFNDRLMFRSDDSAELALKIEAELAANDREETMRLLRSRVEREHSITALADKIKAELLRVHTIS